MINFEECYPMYVTPQGKKTALWCFSMPIGYLCLRIFYAVFAVVSACCVPVSHADVLTRFAIRAVCTVP